jgi:hypothetical protein
MSADSKQRQPRKTLNCLSLGSMRLSGLVHRKQTTNNISATVLNCISTDLVVGGSRGVVWVLPSAQQGPQQAQPATLNTKLTHPNPDMTAFLALSQYALNYLRKLNKSPGGGW